MSKTYGAMVDIGWFFSWESPTVWKAPSLYRGTYLECHFCLNTFFLLFFLVICLGQWVPLFFFSRQLFFFMRHRSQPSQEPRKHYRWVIPLNGSRTVISNLLSKCRQKFGDFDLHLLHNSVTSARILKLQGLACRQLCHGQRFQFLSPDSQKRWRYHRPKGWHILGWPARRWYLWMVVVLLRLRTTQSW